ncbi:MAG: azlC [Alphaproteobacteria bacterium]|nr:azlC [Alphaproteobacteria bacterium]
MMQDPSRPAEKSPAETGPFRRGVRKTLPLLIGTTLFGLGTGAATAQAPIPELALFAMPVAIYAGVGQLAFAQLYTLGTPFPAIAVTLILINLRYIIYSAIASVWPRPKSLLQRLLGPFLVTETSFALGLNEPLADRFRFLLGVGTALWSTWVVTCTIGTLLSSQLPPLKHGYAIPAIVLAPILMNLMKGRQKAMLALVAIGFGLLLSGVPYRLGPLLAGLIAVAGALLFERVWKAWR